MTDDVLLSKRTSLERCIKQIHTYYNQPRTLPFEEDYMLQDALAMNLQRSCELCIDMANDEVM